MLELCAICVADLLVEGWEVAEAHSLESWGKNLCNVLGGLLCALATIASLVAITEFEGFTNTC